MRRFLTLPLVAAGLLAASVALAGAQAALPADSDAGGAGREGRPRIVCLGDSLTEGYSLSPEQAWPALLEGALRKDGWPQAEVVNAGVSGSTSASAVSRLKWQMRLRPDLLILALGANDGLRGVPVEETRRNLAAAIDLARSEGIRVLLAGMRMPPNYGQEYTRDFEQTFVSLASEKNVAFLPFLLDGVAAEPDFNLPDGIHPNAKGYEVIAARVVKHVRPLLESARAQAATGDGAASAAAAQGTQEAATAP